MEKAERREVNSARRLANAMLVTRHDTPLEPLISLRTGQTIAGFPGTSQELVNLQLRDVERILQELELPLDGNARAKRDRLEQATGCYNTLGRCATWVHRGDGPQTQGLGLGGLRIAE
ncbi:hypothetical protein VTI74DRAFT_3065 [Chaetomium olivicolor]